MEGLTLDQFLRAGSDFEGAQYRILGRLQQVRQAFAKNVIYPYLSDLISLYGTLGTIVERLGGLREALPGTIKEIDVEAQRVVYEPTDKNLGQMGFIEDLIQWALPHIQEAIEEGRTIFEFVDENLRLEEVGLRPSYVEEGYLIVPDPQVGLQHVLQYQLSIFTRADERFRSLKTMHVKSVPYRMVGSSPRHLKLELIAERRDLPNPATYYIDTRLDFPFQETMLPVAKRKLMRYLYDHGGLT